METQLDYYGILQVHQKAEKQIIDAAYRRLASKHHPDINHLSDATKRMKKINAAYEVLSNPVKRAAYDSILGVTPASGSPPYAAARSRYRGNAWRILFIAAGLVLFTVLAFRLGFSFLLLSPKLVVVLVVISLVVWLFFTLVKIRR
ncbi:J domain-containing protein [Chloroflexota bacterium]